MQNVEDKLSCSDGTCLDDVSDRTYNNDNNDNNENDDAVTQAEDVSDVLGVPGSSAGKKAPLHAAVISVIKGLKLLMSPYSLIRLFTAWLFVSAVMIAFNRTAFTNNKEFALSVSGGLFVLLVAVNWLVLLFVSGKRAVGIILIAAGSALGIAAASEIGSFVGTVGICLALMALIWFAKPEWLGRAVSMPAKWIASALLMGGFIVFVGLICCLNYRRRYSSCFDFGIFSQMFYYMKETGLPLTTCERDGLLNHFAVHFSPVYYLLLPVYYLFPRPETLLISQAVVVASGAVPLLLICKDKCVSNAQSLLFAVCYLMFPAFAGGCFYYLHENCFLAPLILWLIYFLEKESLLPSLVFAVLLLSVKEDAAVYAAVIALYFTAINKSRKSSVLILAVSVVYFVAVTYLLASEGEGVMTWRYGNYIYDGSGSLFTVVKSVAINPVYALTQCFTADKLMFILQTLLPLGFLPLMLRSPKELILLIPYVLVNLMPDYVYQYSVDYQYVFGSGSLLVYLALVNSRELKNRSKLLMSAAVCAVVVFVSLNHSRVNSLVNSYKNYQPQIQSFDYVQQLVPENASVACSTFLLPNLSQRDEVYELETTKNTAEYYVLDLRFSVESYSVEDFMNDDYEMIYKDDYVAVFRNCLPE